MNWRRVSRQASKSNGRSGDRGTSRATTFMSLMIFAVVLAIALPAPAASKQAKPAPGAPPELVGHWGGSPSQCRSWNRKTEGVTSIAPTTYSSCGGLACESQIRSHSRTKSGFSLQMRGTFSGSNWRLSVRIVDSNVIEIGTDGSISTLVRCTEADAVAGIGLSAESDGSLTSAPAAMFSALYALAVPKEACPELTVDEQAVQVALSVARNAYARFLARSSAFRGDISQSVASSERLARSGAAHAVRQDKAVIADFCERVLGAFGERGTLYPNLIKDPRRRA